MKNGAGERRVANVVAVSSPRCKPWASAASPIFAVKLYLASPWLTRHRPPCCVGSGLLRVDGCCVARNGRGAAALRRVPESRAWVIPAVIRAIRELRRRAHSASSATFAEQALTLRSASTRMTVFVLDGLRLRGDNDGELPQTMRRRGAAVLDVNKCFSSPSFRPPSSTSRLRVMAKKCEEWASASPWRSRSIKDPEGAAGLVGRGAPGGRGATPVLATYRLRMEERRDLARAETSCAP